MQSQKPSSIKSSVKSTLITYLWKWTFLGVRKTCYICAKATQSRDGMRNIGGLINLPLLTVKSSCHSRWPQDLCFAPAHPFLCRCLCLLSSPCLWIPGFYSHRSCILTPNPTISMEFLSHFSDPALGWIVPSKCLCSPRTSEWDLSGRQSFCRGN